MATIDVKDASNNTVPIEKPIAPGRALAAASHPVALSTEDAAALALLHTDLATTLAGFLDGLEALIGTTNAGNASILAKLSADPATQTTLAALLAKVIAAPATEAKQDAANTLLAAATPAGENHLGSVGGNTVYIDVALTLDTAIYASGDVLADTQVITNAMRVADGLGVLQSIAVIDQDDQKAAINIFLLSANVPMGTENLPPSISDVNALQILGAPISIGTADYFDLGGASVAGKDAIGKVVKPAAGTRNLYVAVVNGTGTPTYTATGVTLRFGFLQD
ncbi:hypothetical protein RQ479_07970 [Mesorhizobium sp. ISC25]|uniref:hypothetical protein n=1 Tax=Mesorhizobium sp. ISC25 TaxID=3077335 RepID=UPI0035D94F11